MIKRYPTKDIGLAAALMALGAVYDGADKSNPRQMTFYFVSPEPESDDTQPFDFEKVERLWVADALIGNLKHNFRAGRDLKSVVHSG